MADSGGWTIAGAPLDLNDPRLIAMAAAERRLLEADYDEYDDSNMSGAAFFRSAALIVCICIPFCIIKELHFFFFLASKLVILFSLSCFPFTPSTNGGTRGHRVASGHSPAPQKEKYSLRKFYRNSPFT